MTPVSSIKIDSIATTPDSFKDCLLACKISNQVPTNFEERKVPQAASGNFVQKWLFCKTNVLYNICLFICGENSLKNMFEVVHTYYRSFSRKIYWTAISITVPLYQSLWTDIFKNSYL